MGYPTLLITDNMIPYFTRRMHQDAPPGTARCKQYKVVPIGKPVCDPIYSCNTDIP